MYPFYLKNSFIQTISSKYRKYNDTLLKNNYQNVDLGDKEELVINLQDPQSPSLPIIVMTHGLGGSEDSFYMRRIANLLLMEGYGVARVNARNAGPGLGLCYSPNNAGRSEDVLAVINYLSKLYPNTPLLHLGFSLSGNQGLKMLGEGGLPGSFVGAIEVCPPCDLKRTSNKILKSQLGVYDWYFTKILRQQINQVNQLLFNQDFIFESNKLNLYLIDEEYTAPNSGFNSANEYYETSSSKNFLDKIQLPTVIIAAENDPVIDNQYLLNQPLPDSIELIKEPYGGHVGFLRRGGFSLDALLLEKIRQLMGRGILEDSGKIK